MALHSTADRIFSRARGCEERNRESRIEVHPHPRSGAASPATERARRVIRGAERDTLTRPSPSSSPLQGEGTGKWAPRSLGVGLVAIYRAAISPVIHAINGPACRFEPSCSEYARDAIAMHGIVRGGAMAIWRIARCNPAGGHGFDPVPDRIVNRACEGRPHPRSGAASPATERARRVISSAERDTLIRPSPSSSPLRGEETA
jgi:putative membrane protein insertion efficiency factor